MTKVAVLIGCSAEREISLKTAAGVAAALQERGFRTEILEIGPGLVANIEREKPDLAFIASHGPFGEDGTIQGLLEILGLTYVGSGVLASSLAMNKAMAKRLFSQAGIPTPESWTVMSTAPWHTTLKQAYQLLEDLGALVVKPSGQGSSIGISIVRETAELREALAEAFHFDNEILLERLIEGKELAVPVFGDEEPRTLPVVEILPKKDFYDYEAKYSPGMSIHLVPPRLPQEVVFEAERIGLSAHQLLGCRDISRADIMVDNSGCCWLLEVNTLPGMTETSLVPDAARALGWSYADLVEKLVRLALQRKG